MVFWRSWVLSAPLCLAGDFNSQLRHILHTQMLSAQDPIISRTLDDVRATLNQRWQGYELTVGGSISVGLGTIESDIDVHVQFPNFNASSYLNLLEETEKLFNKQPELYSQVTLVNTFDKLGYFLRFNHIPTKRIVEIFEFGIGNSIEKRKHSEEKGKLIQYYFELDKRFKPLGVFLKYWFRTHDLTGHERGCLTDYALYLLIIFYLQQKNMAPPTYVLLLNSTTQYISDWKLGFNELPYRTTNTENLHQLLGGFFKYYSEFNFEKYIVSPFTGRPIPRNAFTDVENFPKEYTLYDNTLNHTTQPAIKKLLNTEIIVQDAFMHDLNTADQISHERAKKFKYLMKSVATMFEELPSDRILKAILVTGEQKHTVINHNNATEDGINKQSCIKITDPHAAMSHA